MDNFLSEFYLGKRQNKYVLVVQHYRHMKNGSLVFVPAHLRRKWGTRK